MGFAGGSITFKRFFVQGEAPALVNEALIEQLSARAMGRDSIQTADHTDMGWITASTSWHRLYVRQERHRRRDGLFAPHRYQQWRRATWSAVTSAERGALLEASGREFLSKSERRQAKKRRSRGRSPRPGRGRSQDETGAVCGISSGARCTWGPPHERGRAVHDAVRPDVRAEPGPVSSGELRRGGRPTPARPAATTTAAGLLRTAPGRGGERRTSRGADQGLPGTEWLTWLWYTSQVEARRLPRRSATVTVLFEKSIQMDCAFPPHGKLTVQADDPTRLPESTGGAGRGQAAVRAGLQVAAEARASAACGAT